MSLAIYTIFGLTLFAALLGVIGFGPSLFENLLGLLGIALLATAGGIAAIRTHRDYLRNSMRSDEMAYYLTVLKDQMSSAEDHESLLRIVTKTEETMLLENEDWHVVVLFQEYGLPV